MLAVSKLTLQVGKLQQKGQDYWLELLVEESEPVMISSRIYPDIKKLTIESNRKHTNDNARSC